MPKELTAEEELELEDMEDMHEEEDDLEYWGDYPDRI